MARCQAEALAGIDVVAMDGFTGFKTAAAEELPDATPVMDPFHVIRLAGDALENCRRRVQHDIFGRWVMKSDPLYQARRSLLTGAGLLTDKQQTRLHALFADERHTEVEATCGIYQDMITAYREKDRRLGKFFLGHTIEKIRTGVPEQVAEIRKLARTLTQRATDVLGYFDRPGTSNGPAEAINGRLEHLRAPPTDSETSRTMSRGHCWKPEDSDHDYTLLREEPDSRDRMLLGRDCITASALVTVRDNGRRGWTPTGKAGVLLGRSCVTFRGMRIADDAPNSLRSRTVQSVSYSAGKSAGSSRFYGPKQMTETGGILEQARNSYWYYRSGRFISC